MVSFFIQKKEENETFANLITKCLTFLKFTRNFREKNLEKSIKKILPTEKLLRKKKEKINMAKSFVDLENLRKTRVEGKPKEKFLFSFSRYFKNKIKNFLITFLPTNEKLKINLK